MADKKRPVSPERGPSKRYRVAPNDGDPTAYRPVPPPPSRSLPPMEPRMELPDAFRYHYKGKELPRLVPRDFHCFMQNAFLKMFF